MFTRTCTCTYICTTKSEGVAKQLSRTPIKFDGCSLHPGGAKSHKKPKRLHAGAIYRATNDAKWSNWPPTAGFSADIYIVFSKSF